MENKEQLFGVKALDYQPKINALSVLKQILTLQSIKFWIFTYVIAFVFYYLFTTDFIKLNKFIPFLATDMTWMYIINMILFPFSAILLGTLAIKARGQVYRLLYPSIQITYVNQHFFVAIILGILTIILYIIVWRFSFVIGIIGIIITVNDALKLLK